MKDYYEIVEDVENLINNHTYVVDQWLLDTLDKEAKKPAYSSRENVDALALELTAIKVGKMKVDKISINPETGEEEGYQWRHDWKYDENTFIDLKRKPHKYSNLSLTGISKMVESYARKQLTHIVGFSQNIEHNYKIGDKLTFKFEGMLPFRDAVDESSRGDGNYRLLSVSCLQKPKIKV